MFPFSSKNLPCRGSEGVGNGKFVDVVLEVATIFGELWTDRSANSAPMRSVVDDLRQNRDSYRYLARSAGRRLLIETIFGPMRAGNPRPTGRRSRVRRVAQILAGSTLCFQDKQSEVTNSWSSLLFAVSWR